MKPRILMLSLSRDLAEETGRGFNEAQRRQLAYAAFCESVDIVVKANTPGRTRVLAPGVRVHPTGTLRNAAAAFAMLRLGTRLIHERGCSLVVAQEPLLTGVIGYLLARRFGLPFCLHYLCDLLDNDFWLGERRAHGLLNAVGKWVIRRATVVRVDSPDQRERVTALGVDAERVHYVPFMQHGLSAFATTERTTALRDELLGDGDRLVLTVARLDPQKDLKTFLEVVSQTVARSAGTRFVVIGDGPERSSFNRDIRERGLTKYVRTLGSVEFASLASYFAASDLFLLTSKYETAARVLVLARVTGLPIVSTAVSGADELIAPAGGIIAPVGDSDALANGILALSERLDEARARAADARGSALASYDEAAVVTGMQQLYAAAIARGRRHRPKLAYVLPKYDPATEEHFLHTYGLLEAIANRVSLVVIVERGVHHPRIGRAQVLTQRWTTVAPLRLLEIAWMCLRVRVAGCRHFYVHYSYFGALAAWLVTRVFGGHVYYWHCVSMFFRKSGWSRDALVHRLTAELPLALTMRLTDYLVTGTRSLAGLYARTFGFSSDRIRVVPNEVRPERFAIAADVRHRHRAGLGIGADEPVVLFVHRLAPRKGAHHLPAIARGLFARVPNARLLVVGDGPSGRELRALVAREPVLAARVHVAGWVPNSEIPVWYAAADAFVMPSEEEGFPRVLLEAMAAGVPFVAADVGGVRDICDASQQWSVVPAGDIDAFVDKLGMLLQDPMKRRTLAAAGIARVQQYTVERVADITLAQLAIPDALVPPASVAPGAAPVA